MNVRIYQFMWVGNAYHSGVRILHSPRFTCRPRVHGMVIAHFVLMNDSDLDISHQVFAVVDRALLTDY